MTGSDGAVQGVDDAAGVRRKATTRERFLTLAATAGAAATGLALAAASPLTGAEAAAPAASRASRGTTAMGCNESVQDIVNTALTVERLAMTFYYTGLTTRTVIPPASLRARGGTGLAAPPPRESLKVVHSVSALQAALDQERGHAQFWTDFGASSPYEEFYFPSSTFRNLGYTSHFGMFLGVLDHLETAFVGAYLAAIKRLGALNHADLAVFCTRVLAVECEHRALGRVVAGDYPVDNVTLEVNSFACVGDAVSYLKPFLSGKGFRGGATRAIRVPTQAQITRVVGLYTSV